jgi:flagellar biosynthesis protein FlhF
MKIIRHTARDMRQALRGVREQLGEDAVILSSRRTSEGVEVTAAVDFDASNLEAGGFADTPPALAPPPAKAPPRTAPAKIIDAAPIPTAPRAAPPAARPAGSLSPTALALTSGRAARANKSEAAASFRQVGVETAQETASQHEAPLAPAPSYDELAALERPTAAYSSAAGYEPTNAHNSDSEYNAGGANNQRAPNNRSTAHNSAAAYDPGADHHSGATYNQRAAYQPVYDADWISEAAREAVAEHVAAPRAPVLPPAATPTARAAPSRHAARAPDTEAHAYATAPQYATAAPHTTPQGRAAAEALAERYAAASYEVLATEDPVEEIREATLTPLASNEVKATFAAFEANAAQANAAATPGATEAMGNELKSLRRMLENQLAHLAWNDLTRRAPVHTEILRELTEIGITQDLAEHLVRQLPEDTDLTFARRFTIAGLSQYLKVTGDRWLDDGGRVAFVGATGVGKTTTLAKIAVRWVLRHGARDIALVAADSVRIGAQDQLQSLAQMLGVPVYTPENFDQLPTLLSRLNERLILIDTPGSSVRDTQLAGRLAVLSNSASKLETALVLAASTQAGAIEEAVRRFAPANPPCCVLTKLDEAASLGGVLSALIRARLPVSYMSEGQRVPEDLRPARALELVSAAVRLAKARGATADEDLLRRRFGKTAHGIS